MLVMTAPEVLKNYARYAVIDLASKTSYGLYWDVEEAKAVAANLCARDGAGRYDVAVIA